MSTGDLRRAHAEMSGRGGQARGGQKSFVICSGAGDRTQRLAESNDSRNVRYAGTASFFDAAVSSSNAAAMSRMLTTPIRL